MSNRAFILIYVLIVSFGLSGMWLGFRNYDPSAPRYLLGFLMVLGAAVALIVAFRRDLRVSEGEKRAEWERVRVRGRRAFILRQTAAGLLGFSPYIIANIYEAVESAGGVVERLGRLGAETAVVLSLCLLVGLAWWRFKEWRYAGSF